MLDSRIGLPSPDAFITDDYINRVLSTQRWSDHGGDLCHFIDDKCQEEPSLAPLRDRPHDEIVTHDTFKAFFRQWLALRYRYVLNDLAQTITGEQISIYRAVYLTEQQLKEVIAGQREIGVYWTTGVAEAWAVDPHTQKDAQEYVFEARVALTDINWHETLISRFDYSNGDDEQEINLTGKPVPTVCGIERADDGQLVWQAA